jgi:hypothetical protein
MPGCHAPAPVRGRQRQSLVRVLEERSILGTEPDLTIARSLVVTTSTTMPRRRFTWSGAASVQRGRQRRDELGDRVEAPHLVVVGQQCELRARGGDLGAVLDVIDVVPLVELLQLDDPRLDLGPGVVGEASRRQGEAQPVDASRAA